MRPKDNTHPKEIHCHQMMRSPPIRQEGALHPKADHAYDRAADSSQRYPLNIIMPFGMCTGTTAMESSLVHRSQQGLTFQEGDGQRASGACLVFSGYTLVTAWPTSAASIVLSSTFCPS